MKRLVMALVCAFAVKAMLAETIYVTAANFESCRTLQNGNTYLFAEDIDYTAGDCQSAMTVADGATATIQVAKGVCVKLTGGVASGTAGAGAGIEVPAGAKLVVAGAGELFATGGKGGAGANGGQGKEGNTGDYDTSTTSSGGRGGDGGGGAGAGIGGKGGAGGMGGTGGGSASYDWDDPVAGQTGSNGGTGGIGGACGSVEVRGTVTVIAHGGIAGANGAGGAKTNWRPYEGYTYYWAAYGSGGGGGGGGGSTGADIGGGGGGGGAGGGGGGGGLSYDMSCYDIITFKKNGLGGAGGQGDGSSTGEKGADRTNESTTYDGCTYNAQTTDDGYGTGGLGGNGGAAGAMGGAGTLRVSSSARVNGAGGEFQDPMIDGVNIWASASDVWTFDFVSGKVTLLKNGLYTLTGGVIFENALAVKLTGLKPGVALNAAGLSGITSLTTDGTGTITGLYLIDGNYNFTLGDAAFSFTVSGGSATEFAVTYSASFVLGEHIASVSYSTEPNVASGTAKDDFTLTGLPQGTKIRFTEVVVEDVYDYRGAKEFTVGAENMQVILNAVHAWFPKVEYCDAQGHSLEARRVVNFSNRASDTIGSHAIGGGEWYLVESTNEVGTLTVSGEANLILADGAKLTVNGGIMVEGSNALNIFCQREATGELIANGAARCAGIGGQNPNYWAGYGNCGTVTINGGVVTATGGMYGAGIGGGWLGTCGTVTINDGMVTATGGMYGAGIGGGDGGAGGTVTINGGSVKASSIQSQPKDDAGANVYCVTVEVEKVESVEKLRVDGLDDYGTRDIVPVDGKVYLWLPNATHVFTVGGVKYRAVVKAAATTAILYPTCAGGEMVEGAGGEWVVTPNAGVTTVTIRWLTEGNLVVVPPSLAQVNGVADAQIAVRSGGYNITGAFTVAGGAIALNENGTVTIGGETIPVRPTIFLHQGCRGQVGVSVTMRTIPGLKYTLLRTDALRRDEGIVPCQTWAIVGEPVIATGATVTLIDGESPAGQAFYKVGVER